MALAFLVMSQTGEAKCFAELNSQVRDLKMAMMDVAVGSPPTSREVVFRMPVCAGLAVDGLRFAYYEKPLFCSSCPGRYGACWKIEPIVYDAKAQNYRTSDVQQCVEMSGDVQIYDQGTCVDLYDASSPEDARCPTLSYRVPDGECRSDVFTGAGVRSFLTLGKELGKEAYRIRLTKKISVGAGAAKEIGLIEVCVQPIQR